MSRTIPDEISALAEARSAARASRNFAEADRLRAQIEAAGWTVVDVGLRVRLTRTQPLDVEQGGRVLHGSSASVPSRFDEPDAGTASVVIRATDWPADVERALAGLRRHAPAGTQIVVVADAPSAEQASAIESLEQDGIEVVWTAQRLGVAGALNAGLRRTRAAVVIVLDPRMEATGDVVSPLVAALRDPTVAVTGAFGLTSGDLRTWIPAAAGDVDAIDGSLMAFRRADVASRGPLDEFFRLPPNLDVWWSLVLRDGGQDAAPRRAVALDLPLRRHQERPLEEPSLAERERLAKRTFYRIIDRFGRRTDLLAHPSERGRPAEKAARTASRRG